MKSRHASCHRAVPRGIARSAALLAAVLLAGCESAPPPGAPPAARKAVQTFTLPEAFGVAHPDQIVDFDLNRRIDPAKYRLVDEQGAEVVYQLLDSGRKLALRTDLPAGASKTWYLVKGKPALANGVTVVEAAAHYEIANEQLAIRVAKPLPPGTDLSAIPAPVQGVRLRDGTWTATGPNYLRPGTPPDPMANALTNMTVRFLERGPLKVVVEVAYGFDKPEYRYGQQVTGPAGPGFYTSTITVEAGQPSVLFEEDNNLIFAYSLDFYGALHPTNARYRGHYARAREHGYEPDGQQYRGWLYRPPLDAQVDLRYDTPRYSGYVTTPDMWRWMAVWDPWAFDSGWYWQMYDANAGPNSNLLGIFAGRASRALGAHNSAVGIYTLPGKDGGQPQAGLTIQSHRRGPTGQVYPRSRWRWGLFVGTKADLAAPDQIQPVNRQMNLHGGFNLNKVHRYAPLDFPDPQRGYGAAYMDRRAMDGIVQRVRDDKGGRHGSGYLGFLCQADAYTWPLVEMWADPTGEKVRAAAKRITDLATELLDAYVNRGGIYEMRFHYWHGGTEMMRMGLWIDQVLATDALTPAERARVKAAAVLFAHALWDNDFVPMFDGHGLNMGTANMPVQQSGMRSFYALYLAEHPGLRDHARPIGSAALDTVRGIINEHGAEMGCTHYIGASFTPTLNLLLQLKQLGGPDPFAAEPRLAKFGEFYLNLLTPPEPRIGGKRGFIALGDSGTEPSEIYGMLGTGFRDADPKLSARLMGAWQAGGKPHSSFYGTTFVMIDDQLPAADPALGDATFPGYYSVLRHGWGATNETAAWFVNGDHYSDHRHADHGSLVLYALGQPLAVDWSAIYTPQAPGAYYHSGVVLEDSLGRPWDADSPPLGSGGGWSGSTQEAFVTAPDRAYARARFTSGKTQWTRAVTAVRIDPARPILVVRDTFAGEQAAAPKVLTLNLMMTGAVDTPAGKVTPPARTHVADGHKDGEPGHELASATPPIALAPGVNRFGFTGARGVDAAVFVLTDQPQQALLGNWANPAWGAHVTDREERQHILRVRGTGGFTTVILPWRQGEAPAGLDVARDGDAVVVKTATATVTIAADGTIR